MAPKRGLIRLADIPAHVRLAAVKDARLEWPKDGPELLAAAIYPDPEHGEWIAVPPATILEAAA